MQQPTDLSKLMQLARSQAGQLLIALLQQNGGEALQNALTKASAGDYSQAQQTLSQLLEDPQAKQLLSQLGGGK